MTHRRRELVAEAIYERLHPVMGWLALLFVVIVLGDNSVRDESPFDTIFTAGAWIVWACFVLEYMVRLAIAPSKRRFFARTWWQIVFLVLPFLGFLRIIVALRVARAGRAVSAVIRTSRTAAQTLSNRVAWLGAVTLIVILLATDLLYELGGVRPYVVALHDVALAAIVGHPLGSPAGIAQILDVVLALYAVVVFAALAGSLGAFFFEKRAASEGSVQ